MKKLFAIIATVLLLGLTSCNNSQDNTKRTDNPSAELRTMFKLDSVDSGSVVNEYDANAKDYYTIKLATDKNSTLFIYTTSIDDKIREISTTIDYFSINFLRFESTITQDEVNAVSSQFYKDEVLKASEFGLEKINVNSTQYQLTVSSEVVDNVKVNNDLGYKITTAYVPALVTHVRSNTVVLEAYFMLPLYTEIYQNVTSNFDGIADFTTTIAFENSYIVKA